MISESNRTHNLIEHFVIKVHSYENGGKSERIFD